MRLCSNLPPLGIIRFAAVRTARAHPLPEHNIRNCLKIQYLLMPTPKQSRHEKYSGFTLGLT